MPGRKLGLFKGKVSQKFCGSHLFAYPESIIKIMKIIKQLNSLFIIFIKIICGKFDISAQRRNEDKLQEYKIDDSFVMLINTQLYFLNALSISLRRGGIKSRTVLK